MEHREIGQAELDDLIHRLRQRDREVSDARMSLDIDFDVIAVIEAWYEGLERP